MDIKKIGVIMLGIAIICLIIGAIYLEANTGESIRTRYYYETSEIEHSYDGEQLIVDNMVVENAKDVSIHDGVLEYTVYESGSLTGHVATPMLVIVGMGLGFLILMIIMDD